MVTRTKKIFVGGLSAPTTIEDVRTYFEQFGPVSYMLRFSVQLLKLLRTLNFIITRLWRCQFREKTNFLLLLYTFFQIEDAMLMFDKQTNRHRGKT